MSDPNRLGLTDPGLIRVDGYIDGCWTPPDSGRRFDVVDPASGESIAAVADMGPSETGRAVAAATAALDAWRALTAKQRSAVLRRWYELMVDNAADLGAIVTAEMGKPLAEGRGEILAGAAYVEWFAEEAKRAYGETIPTHDPAMRLVVIKQPVGVVAAITPWNFPFATVARKAAPALAAGCTVVAKPAEDTPLSALALAELAERAGGAGRGVQRGDRLRPGCCRRRVDLQPGGEEDLVHRQHRGGQAAHGPGRRHRQEGGP